MESEHIATIHPPSITFSFWLVDKSVAYIYPSASNHFWVSFIKRTQPIGFLGNKRGISSPPARPEKLWHTPTEAHKLQLGKHRRRGSATCPAMCVAILEVIIEQRYAVTPSPPTPPSPCTALEEVVGGGGVFSLARSQGLNPLCNPFLLIYTAAAVWRACASAVLVYNCECVCERVCPSSRPLISQSAGEDCGGPSGMCWIL